MIYCLRNWMTHNKQAVESLLICYLTISLETAENILQLQLSQDLDLVSDFEDLVDLDLNDYLEQDLGYTNEHQILFDEIRQIKNAEEKHKELLKKRITAAQPSSNYSLWQIYGGIIGVGFILYFISTKTTKESSENEPGNTKKRE